MGCVCSISGATCVQVRHLGVCLYGFEMDMSKRVHFKVLYFYILQHFTLTGGLGVIKGGVRGVGGSTHLVSYFPLHAHG